MTTWVTWFSDLLGTVALMVVIVVVGYALISGGCKAVGALVDAIIEWTIQWRRSHLTLEDQVLISHLNIEKLEREMGLSDDDG